MNLEDFQLECCTYNTAGACGDLILSNPHRARGKDNCIKDVMTKHDVTFLQELHADELERNSCEQTLQLS